MLLLFEICFFVGIGLTILLTILGQFFDFIGADGLDINGIGVDFLLPLSPTVYILFCTVFGGVGLILLELFPLLPNILMVLISLLTGFLLSVCFYKGVILPLKKAQNTSAPSQNELIGVTAKVVESIPVNGYGEITYVVNGNSFIAPAKTMNGHHILRETDVIIYQIEEYVFYVIERELLSAALTNTQESQNELPLPSDEKKTNSKHIARKTTVFSFSYNRSYKYF